MQAPVAADLEEFSYKVLVYPYSWIVSRWWSSVELRWWSLSNDIDEEILFGIVVKVSIETSFGTLLLFELDDFFLSFLSLELLWCFELLFDDLAELFSEWVADKGLLPVLF